jgi:hypothetical protein
VRISVRTRKPFSSSKKLETDHAFCAAECDHFIRQAQPRLTRAEVVDDEEIAQGTSYSISDVRTSSGAFLDRGETDIIANVEERVSQWVMVDKGQGEGFQVLDYKVHSPVLNLLQVNTSSELKGSMQHNPFTSFYSISSCRWAPSLTYVQRMSATSRRGPQIAFATPIFKAQ